MDINIALNFSGDALGSQVYFTKSNVSVVWLVFSRRLGLHAKMVSILQWLVIPVKLWSLKHSTFERSCLSTNV